MKLLSILTLLLGVGISLAQGTSPSEAGTGFIVESNPEPAEIPTETPTEAPPQINIDEITTVDVEEELSDTATASVSVISSSEGQPLRDRLPVLGSHLSGDRFALLYGAQTIGSEVAWAAGSQEPRDLASAFFHLGESTQSQGSRESASAIPKLNFFGLSSNRVSVSLNGFIAPLGAIPDYRNSALNHDLLSIPALNSGLQLYRSDLTAINGGDGFGASLDFRSKADRAGAKFELSRIFSDYGDPVTNYSVQAGIGSVKHNWIIHLDMASANDFQSRNIPWLAEAYGADPTRGLGISSRLGSVIFPVGFTTTESPTETFLGPNNQILSFTQSGASWRNDESVSNALSHGFCNDANNANGTYCRDEIIDLIDLGTHPEVSRSYLQVNHQFDSQSHLVVSLASAESIQLQQEYPLSVPKVVSQERLRFPSHHPLPYLLEIQDDELFSPVGFVDEITDAFQEPDTAPYFFGRVADEGFGLVNRDEERTQLTAEFDKSLGSGRYRIEFSQNSSEGAINRQDLVLQFVRYLLDGYGSTACPVETAQANDAHRETFAMDPVAALMAINEEDEVLMGYIASTDDNADNDPDPLRTEADVQARLDLYPGRGLVTSGGTCLYWDPLFIIPTEDDSVVTSNTQVTAQTRSILDGDVPLSQTDVDRAINESLYQNHRITYETHKTLARFLYEGDRSSPPRIRRDGRKEWAGTWVAGVEAGEEEFMRTPLFYADRDFGTEVLRNEACVATESVLCYGELASLPSLDAGQHSRNFFNVFGEWRKDFSDTSHLQLNGRLDTSGDLSGTSIGAAWAYQPTSSFRLNLRYSNSSKFPSISQLLGGEVNYQYTPAMGRFIVVDVGKTPNLDVEQLSRFSAGFEWRARNEIFDFGLDAEFYSSTLASPIVQENYQGLLTSYLGTICDGVVCTEQQEAHTALGSRLNYYVEPSGGINLDNIRGVRVNLINGPDLETSGIELNLRVGLLGLVQNANFWFGLDYSALLSAETSQWSVSGQRIGASDLTGNLNALELFEAMPETKMRLSFNATYGLHAASLAAQQISGFDDNRIDVNGATGASLAPVTYWTGSYTLTLPDRRTQLSVVLKNLTDEQPPRSLSFYGYESAIYPVQARELVLSLRREFGGAR